MNPSLGPILFTELSGGLPHVVRSIITLAFPLSNTPAESVHESGLVYGDTKIAYHVMGERLTNISTTDPLAISFPY
ncbi:hypothetical protein H0H93_006103, partial [Arthromyces matolae]